MAPNSWLHMQSAPGGQLNCIAPDLGRDNCSIFPSCPSSDGSYDSDATVSKFLHRPCADPHISPVQLPPLCDEFDSDDELFADENTATPHPAAGESVQQPVDEEYSDEDEQQSSPSATQDPQPRRSSLVKCRQGKTDTTLMEYLTHPTALTDANETKLQQRISLRFQSSDPTPVLFHCVFPPPPTRSPAPALPLRPTSRLATGPSVCTVPIKCPRVPGEEGPDLGGVDGPTLAHTCGGARGDMDPERAVQALRLRVDRHVRPHERQRVNSGSGCSSDVRV
ncbi:hypothetical protein C8R44DRAFT_754131 [Mycena epipterygia]|nr:hypothetical protein C8R44DRAFT_754131 [Mycena epipterygia]